MKSEEEVKEFLENLGIEYRFACLHEKKPDGCHLLGDYMEAIKKDYVKAAQVYKNNCDDHGYGHSCHKYGTYKFVGRGTPEDKVESFNYQVKACDAGYPGGCFLAGLALTDDTTKENPIPTDFEKGVGYLTRACELGSSSGCFFASGLYFEGRGSIGKDIKKSFELGVKACDLGSPHACSNVALMYRRGVGVQKDEKKAKFYHDKVIDYQEQLKKMRTITMEEGIDV